MPSRSDADFGLTISVLVASDDVDDVLLASSALTVPVFPRLTTSVKLLVRLAEVESAAASPPSRPKSDLICNNLDLDLPGLLRRGSVVPCCIAGGTPVAGGDGCGVTYGVSCSVERSMIARRFLPPADRRSVACPSRLCVHELAREIGFLLNDGPATDLSSSRGTISSNADWDGGRDMLGSSFSLVVSGPEARSDRLRCRPLSSSCSRCR